jgi:acyl transferase domain-containing protein
MTHRTKTDKSPRSSDIAVIGLAGRFPGAPNADAFWENLKNGTESISFLSDQELLASGIGPDAFNHPGYVKAKGVLAGAEDFDAEFFSYPARDAERMDPQVRLLHECAWEALETAGYPPDGFPGVIGVFLGANDNQEWLRRVLALGDRMGENFDHFLLNYRDYVSTRISYKLNLKGPSFTLLSACSTSLLAVHLACRSLAGGECDMALAGGASLTYPLKSGYQYQEGLMFSSDGHCRTFDARADGTVFGDGLGVVVLKPLPAAVADRDHIFAVIKGSAVNNDGNGKIGFTAPGVDGQIRVIQAALRAAGVGPETIGCVEAHGTGTRLGDPIEYEALRRAFDVKERGICALGSVKTNIGHLNIAAGVSAFIKTVLALEHKKIPPSLHFTAPNPQIDLSAGPFFVNTALRDWPRRGALRRAGVSAFGFGGTNAHVILEEAPSRPKSAGRPTRPSQILVLSAKSPAALKAAAGNLADWIDQRPSLPLADAAFTLARGREAFPWRKAVAAEDSASAVAALRSALKPSLADKKTASAVFMFPGQGAQYVGMAEGVYRSEPVFREYFDLCAAGLRERMGIDIRAIVYPDGGDPSATARELTRTAMAQPAIFAVSYSLARTLMAWNIRPAALIGHSLGEIVAATLAGVFSLDDALELVARRGSLMQQVPSGAMLAVPLSEDEVRPLLSEEISLSAVNAPSLCVVSGPTAAIDGLQESLRDRRIASQRLETSHAYHSRMMDPVLEPFARLGERFVRNAPTIPILSTMTGAWADPAELVDIGYWVRNLRQTVRFSAAVQILLRETSGVLVEVGPGRTLANLVRLHLEPGSTRPIVPTVRGPRENLADENFFLTAVGKLWESGLSVDWNSYYSRERRSRVPLPTYPFERRPYRAASAALDAPRAASWAHQKKIADVGEWFAVPSWKRLVPPALSENGDRPHASWLVLADACGLAEGVIERLRALDQRVVVVRAGEAFAGGPDDEWTIRPSERGDYQRLFDGLGESGDLPGQILHFWTVTPAGQKRIEASAAEAFQNLSFFSLLFLAQVIGNNAVAQDVRITIVSNRMHSLTKTEPIIPEKATVLGPIKVVPQEFPNISCCSVDVLLPRTGTRPPRALVDRILVEATTNTAEPVVAYRDEFRWVQTFERVRVEPPASKKARLREGGVYLVTGGFGGLGRLFARDLGAKTRGKLILTGRTPLPPRRTWDEWLAGHPEDDAVRRGIEAVREIEQTGAEVFPAAADVTDHRAMKKILAEAVRRFGPIRGVIHAAGIPGEGILQLKHVDAAKGILAPKVWGTRVLEELLGGTKLDFFVLCSSIASILGGIGLGDYCAANAFLDAYAAGTASWKNALILSVNWDMWGEVGMGLKTKMPNELKGWLEKELRDGITNREGLDVLERLLAWGGSRNVIVSTRDLQARIDLWIKREFIKQKNSLAEEGGTHPKNARPSLSMDFDPPQTAFEKKIAAAWERLFGLDRVGKSDNFYELGGHSLLATTLVNHLKRELEISLSIRDILDHPTVADLAGHLQAGNPGKG